ncbi:ATP-dependent zinc metalloprotease FtsH [bacterium]|nr:ATP-dependent zinc metalloprotease FtsH [bacterium]
MLTRVTDSIRDRGEVTFSHYINLIEHDVVKEIRVEDTQVYGLIKTPDELAKVLTEKQAAVAKAQTLVQENKTAQEELNKAQNELTETRKIVDSLNGLRSFETTITNMPSQWDLLKQHGVEFAVLNTASPLSNWMIFLIIGLIAILAVVYFIFRPAPQSGGNNLFSMGKSKAKMFMPSTIKEKFSSVAGAAEAKEELQDVVDFLKNPEKYKRLGARITRGVLLVGEPGNGKTLLARAVAGEANCPFFSISGSDFIEVFVGVGAARVRDLFAQARKHAPSIIFIDEIDAVGRHRGSGLGGGHDEREQTLNQLLTEMDGFETSKDPVIVLAASNRPDVLDKALLRPGRFDRRVEVPYPDLLSREQILMVHAKGVQMDPEVDLKKIARGTPGFSGADLANLINEAAIIASKSNSDTITIKDFEEARDKILLGKEVKTIVLSEDERKMTAFHEAGHALIRLLMPEATDPLHKMTIIPRGRALGVTHFLPEREKYSRDKDEMIASIKAALGGRVAEELVFNKLSTGAYSDFQAATAIARDMVCRYGMSDKLGPVIYSQREGEFIYSQHTAETIDTEVRAIIDACYKDAKELLTSNRDKLDKLSFALLEKETMFASEIYELLGIKSREDHKFTE